MRTLSILALAMAVVFGSAARAARAAGPFVFRDVAGEAGLHEALRGMMGHAAA